MEEQVAGLPGRKGELDGPFLAGEQSFCHGLRLPQTALTVHQPDFKVFHRLLAHILHFGRTGVIHVGHSEEFAFRLSDSQVAGSVSRELDVEKLNLELVGRG